ncbi:Pimeloyl-ACP methyl ester carboxylesterase [Ferrithrix thermotolerans DSM 19514]|uniref:Pimeloyl-ACP methyl ester carboxylesterase n=1 Tax=Ferrithrix thermotolerans DSM 19514 TaxID=1121881 RepID=A0A1M4W640_9ACTN|nr:alpha/beta hydrolase [Ferrithrix thermotolerans]SHE76620.1 Pimeloyl-ACP methyl ester carboxylesterase [Ferrithrix thermotolerans DSM 19514]
MSSEKNHRLNLMDTCKPISTLVAQDGSEIPIYLLSSGSERQRAMIVLHATGFSGCTYRELAKSLGSTWDVYAIDFRGHGLSKAYADESFEWSHFASDVKEATGFLESMGYQHIDIFGHSMGGAAAILSLESNNPAADTVFLFEPIIIDNRGIDAVADEDSPLAKAAARRRSTFSSFEEAYTNFISKEPMARFSKSVVADYVTSGFDQLSDGTVSLRCKREIEARIYTLGGVHRAYESLSLIDNRVFVLYGASTDTFDGNHFQDLATQLVNGTAVEVRGVGHFGPMTHPSLVGSLISKLGAARNFRAL